MERYRQYRMMKKLKELLNTPVREERVYTPPNNIYMSKKAGTSSDNNLDPSGEMRLKHVEVVAQLLLQLISRVEEVEAGDLSQIDSALEDELDSISTEIDIHLEELDQGALLTEAEKDSRRVKHAKSTNQASLAGKSTSIHLDVLRNQIQEWRQQTIRRKKKLNRLESSIRELSLNVNDVRCSCILRDKKTSIAALESTIGMGVILLRGVFRDVQIAYSTLNTKS